MVEGQARRLTRSAAEACGGATVVEVVAVSPRWKGRRGSGAQSRAPNHDRTKIWSWAGAKVQGITREYVSRRFCEGGTAASLLLFLFVAA